MAEQNKAAVAYRDGLIYKVITGFEDADAGERWFRHASIDGFHALRDEKTGRPAQLEVVSLAEINKRKGLTKTWREAEDTRAAEIAAAEAEAKRLAEEKAAAEAVAAREQEIKRLVLERQRPSSRPGSRSCGNKWKPSWSSANKATRPKPSCHRGARHHKWRAFRRPKEPT
jgi:hypothetical protein